LNQLLLSSWLLCAACCACPCLCFNLWLLRACCRV
jgi:hypothetical protein